MFPPNKPFLYFMVCSDFQSVQCFPFFYISCKHLYTINDIYAHMTTNIRISKLNRDKLVELKQKGEYKNLDEVITHLITINERFENSTIVRLVKE